MDKEERLRKLQEARNIVMDVRADVNEDERVSQAALIQLRMATNALHKARSELGMYDEQGVCGWKDVKGADVAWQKRVSDL